MADTREYQCTCHKCGHIYKASMEPEQAEALFENYDPTDYECPDCIEWEQKAADIQNERLIEEYIRLQIN